MIAAKLFHMIVFFMFVALALVLHIDAVVDQQDRAFQNHCRSTSLALAFVFQALVAFAWSTMP